MTDPIWLLHDSHWMAIALFGGMFVFVFITCLLAYREEKDAEKRKDTLIQWLVLDLLFAMGIGIAAYLIYAIG